MTMVTLAAVQFSMSDNEEKNIAKAEQFVRKAAEKGATIILLPELFATEYFCKIKNEKHFTLATPLDHHTMIARFQKLAAELQVVLPVSFFEKAGDAYYNSLVMIDADGSNLGLYRKCHIPFGPGYEETFYFTPGDLGFKVFKTRYGVLGAAICWDQWFPEAARAMALAGAQLLLYPTAIGSEPERPDYDSQLHWQLAMQGHAAANMLPVVAANRIGVEKEGNVTLTFYGTSFITNNIGKIIAQAGRDTEEIVMASIDMSEIIPQRQAWNLFQTRRTDLYPGV